MEQKFIFVSLLALLTVISIVSASSLGTITNSVSLNANGVDVSPSDTVAVFAGDTLPVRISFVAADNATDVKVKVWLSGLKSDILASTDRFDVIKDGLYSKLLSIKLPSDIDPSEDYNLVIRIDAKGGFDEQDYSLRIQRSSYNLQVLFVETPATVSAGSSLPVDVVIKNVGLKNLDDTIVTARIPALGIEKRVYFGDLAPVDKANPDKEDAVERQFFLDIPANAASGTYSLEVETFNSDADSSVVKSISVGESSDKGDVFAAVSTKEIPVNGKATYDLVLVNPGKTLQVYEIVPETAANLIVSAETPLVTVPAGSSTTVKIDVQALDSRGTYTFAVNVNSNGQLVKRVNLSANVTGKQLTSGVAVLTVVLAIIFIVLLVILIVLLTRKPEKTEEFGESYY